MGESPQNEYFQKTDQSENYFLIIFTQLMKIFWGFLKYLHTTWTVIMKIMFSMEQLILGIPGYSKEFFRTWKLASQFKGRMPLTLLGNLPLKSIINSSYGQNDALSTINKLRTGQYWVGVLRHIFISTPEDIQAFLSNGKNNSKGLIYSIGLPLGLVNASGPLWKEHRRIIQPSFHMQVLESYVEIFDEKGKMFVQRLVSKANGVPFNIADDIRNLMLLATLESNMGCEDVSEQIPLLQDIFDLFDCFGSHMVYPWLYIPFIYWLSPQGRREKKVKKGVLRFIKEAIQKKIQELRQTAFESNGKVHMQENTRHCFLSHLVAEQMKGAPITEEEIVEEIIQFLMASIDTTVSALQSAMYYLANNRCIQDRIVEELREVFNVDSSVTAEKLHQMRYLHMVLKEILRISPPIWFVARTAGEDTPLPCGLIIPRGAQVLMSIKTLHMDPKMYPNPEIFDPERFSEERKSNIGPYDYLPFMKGPRNCIGYQFATMELKTVLSHIVWNYEIFPDATYKPEFSWSVITHIANGTRIALRPRCKNM